jgi:hypothetical protein
MILLNYSDYPVDNLTDSQLLEALKTTLKPNQSGDDYNIPYDLDDQLRAKFPPTKENIEELKKHIGIDVPILIHDSETDMFGRLKRDNAYYFTPEQSQKSIDNLTNDEKERELAKKLGHISVSRRLNSLATIAHELGHAKSRQLDPSLFERKLSPTKWYDFVGLPALIAAGVMGVKGYKKAKKNEAGGTTLIGLGILSAVLGGKAVYNTYKREKAFQTKRMQDKEIIASKLALDALNKLYKDKTKRKILHNDLALALSTYGVDNPLKVLK